MPARISSSEGECPHSQKDSNSYTPSRPPRVWQIDKSNLQVPQDFTMTKDPAGFPQWHQTQAKVNSCLGFSLPLLQSLQPCLQQGTWDTWDLLQFQSLSLPWKSWRQTLLQKLQRYTGSSCQPQHFFSSAATGEEWGLGKSRRKSLGLVWHVWSWAPKCSLRGCITGCSVSVTCGRRLPLAMLYMHESFWKQAPTQG